MSTEPLLHSAITQQVIDTFYQVFDELGYGFLESVYEKAMYIALTDLGLEVQRQARVKVYFRGHVVGVFKTDLLVVDRVACEIKAAREIDSSHEAQLLNFLRSSELEVGLLLHFGPKPKFRRLVYGNTRKFVPGGG